MVIKEYIYKGAMIIDVAEALNVPVTVLKTWINENNHEADIEEASILSAEGYIRTGEQLLKAATNAFELNKAKAIIEHGRFMASKKDKKTYGNQIEVTGGPAQVHYIFSIPASAPQILDAKAPEVPLIEAEYNIMPRLDLTALGLPPKEASSVLHSGVRPVEVPE